MSSWTYVHGTIGIDAVGRTQPEMQYIIDTVLEHLPHVTGSEGDMDVYVIRKKGHNSSSSCDEFGRRTDNATNWYKDRRSYNGMFRKQSQYILVVDGALRDREFDETFREFQKWLIRLAKRITVEKVLVTIKDYYKTYTINDDYDYYVTLFEDASYYSSNKTGEPAWWEYLLWQPVMDKNGEIRSRYPAILARKYFNDVENDKRVEEWLGIKIDGN